MGLALADELLLANPLGTEEGEADGLDQDGLASPVSAADGDGPDG